MASRNVFASVATPEHANFNWPSDAPGSPKTRTTHDRRSLSTGSDAAQQVDDFDDADNRAGAKESSSKMLTFFGASNEVVKANAGLLLVVASQAFFSMMNTGVKVLRMHDIDPPITTLQLILVRMITTMIFCVIYMFWAKIPDPFLGPKGVRIFLITRGFGGFFGLFGIYYPLQYLSLSDATVLTFLAPMFTGMAGSFLLGETFTRRQAVSGFVSFAGVVLIARPTFIFTSRGSVEPPSTGVTPTQRLTAVAVAMFGVLGATVAYLSLRAIGRKAHPMHAMLSFSIQCITVSAAAMLIQKTPVVIPTRLDWLAIFFMIGIFGFFGQILLTMGLARETAGRGTMAVYTLIVFSMISEMVFLHTMPTLLSVIGTSMIIGSAIYVALTKEKEGAAKDSIHLPRLSDHETLEEGLLSRHSGDGNEASSTRRPALS